MTKAATKTAKPASLTCDVCGATFTRPASLGAHRRHAHGIEGAGRPNPRRAATVAAAARSGRPVVRDDLLAALFDRIPPRAEVLHDVQAWLDEGERIAAAR